MGVFSLTEGHVYRRHNLATNMLVVLVQQKSPRRGGTLKNLCARATELTDSLSRSAVDSSEV